MPGFVEACAMRNQSPYPDRSAGSVQPFHCDRAGQIARSPVDRAARGRGTIRFGQQAATWRKQSFANLTRALDPVPQFLAIDDAHRAFDLIQRTITS
jgi:hypothetical protein